MKLAGIFFFALAALRAQTMVAPLAGTMVDIHGRIALLHGVLGNLLPPQYAAMPPELVGQAILSAAFNLNGEVFKTESQLVVLDGSGAVISVQPAPQGPALFSFSAGGNPEWVLYTTTAELVNINSGKSIDTAAFGNAVVALGIAGTELIPVLTSDSQGHLRSGFVSLPGGTFQSQAAVSGAAPCAAFQNGWLTTTPSGLFWTPLAAGTPGVSIALTEPAQKLQMPSMGAMVVNDQWLLNARFQLLEVPHMPPPPIEANIGNPPARAR